MAWAVGRVGGHLRVDPARRGLQGFSDEDLADLLDDARRWQRVRDNGILDPDDLLSRVVGGLFGIRMDGAGGRLEIRPHLPVGWRGMALRRLRAHRTILDLEVRPRAEWVTVRIAVTFGPPMAVVVSLPEEVLVSRTTVDDIPLDAPHAIFTAQGEHEVVLYTARPLTP